MYEVSTEERIVLEKCFQQFYVLNTCNDAFLARQKFHVKLNTFHCYCYGNTKEGTRAVRGFQFHRCTSQGYEVYVQEGNRVLQIRDLIHLRRDIFQFVDHTSLFRSSFLYDPFEQKVFRLHHLHLFLYLPCSNLLQWVGFVTNKKKKQILCKLKCHYQKIEKSIEPL